MDMAVSIDIDAFREAEREAQHLRMSIPELCSIAIQEYVKNSHKSEITQQLDAVYASYTAEIDEDIHYKHGNLCGYYFQSVACESPAQYFA